MPDWFKEGGREDDWTRIMMSVLRLTAWESGSHVKNKSRQMTDYRSFFLNLTTSFISIRQRETKFSLQADATKYLLLAS